MTDGVVIAVISALGTVLVGFLTWGTARRASRVEQHKTEAETWAAREDKLWAELNAQVKDLRAQLDAQGLQIRDLQAARAEDQAKIARLQRDLRHTLDTLRDRDELVADFLEHTQAVDTWLGEGGAPPPPAKSWRIRQHIEALQEQGQEATR